MDTARIESLLEQQNRLLREQSEHNKRESKRRSESEQQSSESNDWTALAIEFGVCLLWLSGLVVFNEFQKVHRGEDTLVDHALGTDFQSPLKVGDDVAGYKITSGFGMRKHPVTGELRPHEGVDLGTPVGVQLHFPFPKGQVECLDDPNGYGRYAIAKSPSVGTEILLGHLSKCQSGSYSFGNIFGETGNSGMSTDPHLHFEQLENGQPVPPQKGWLVQVITGNPVQDVPVSAQKGLDGLINRIVLQESGGDHDVVNEIGALGLGQIMPENLGITGTNPTGKGSGWDLDILGRDLTRAEFLADPNLQMQIIEGKIAEYLNDAADQTPYEACRSVASAWYSGDPGLKDSQAPQGAYPTIQAYTQKVCEGYTHE
jgi:murein DD-endopeptidase MepM/ murein hydrolase activator NlpD